MSRAAGLLNHNHSFVWTQGTPASVWTITHNLGRKPSITVVDSGNTVVYGARQYVNDNIVIITFNGTFSGKAYLN